MDDLHSSLSFSVKYSTDLLKICEIESDTGPLTKRNLSYPGIFRLDLLVSRCSVTERGSYCQCAITLGLCEKHPVSCNCLLLTPNWKWEKWVVQIGISGVQLQILVSGIQYLWEFDP